MSEMLVSDKRTWQTEQRVLYLQGDNKEAHAPTLRRVTVWATQQRTAVSKDERELRLLAQGKGKWARRYHGHL